jgi:hypothetical protein
MQAVLRILFKLGSFMTVIVDKTIIIQNNQYKEGSYERLRSSILINVPQIHFVSII